jgi:hypothetical protein
MLFSPFIFIVYSLIPKNVQENNITFVVARQAKDVYQYKNIKEKLHITNVTIWHNKLCRQLHLTPKYIAIKCAFVGIRLYSIRKYLKCFSTGNYR